MPWGRGGLGIRKHRQAKVHGNVTPSGPTKLALQRAVAELRGRRAVLTEWYGTVAEVFRAKRAL